MQQELKAQNVTKLKMYKIQNSKCNKIQKLKMWQIKEKNQIVTKLILWEKKNEIVTKLKNLNCDKTQTIKFWQNSKTQIVTKHNLKINF